MNTRARQPVEMGPDGLTSKDHTTAAKARRLLIEAKKARADERAAQARVGVIVQELRTLGASWSVIGAATGLSRAGAFKRYAKDELR